VKELLNRLGLKMDFYIKLPMKDKQGRSAYFDLTYILPFGDLLAGNFFEKTGIYLLDYQRVKLKQ